LISVLNDALSGKTVLLQEVHHRVKNNLALITALLEMQADTLDDERAITALRESQQRVMSMALIHEYLYGNEHLDRVNFAQYMEQLTGQLCASYAIEGDLVSIRIAAEDIDLPMQRAIPCGLIVNELLTNALKHAYARGNGGEIIIQLVRLKSGKLMLSCQDRGKGIPESFDWKNSTSLGLRIIQILTKQLDGELKLDRSGGTRFELVFPSSSVDPLHNP
jgi:two-component sensor histidine kinase